MASLLSKVSHRRQLCHILRYGGTRIIAGVLYYGATLRLVVAALCVWGVAVYEHISVWFLALGSVIFLSSAAYLWARSESKHPLIVKWLVSVVMLAAMASSVVAAVRYAHSPASEVYRGSAILISDPRTTASGIWVADVTASFGSATVFSRQDIPPAGSTLDIDADIIRRGAQTLLFLNEPARVVSPPSWPWTIRSITRDFLQSVSGHSHSGARLLPGLIIGDTSKLDHELIEDMRTVSLSHVTAVSGTNITIISVAVIGVLSFMSRNRTLNFLIACVIVGVYVFIVGLEPSVLRAFVMGALGSIVILRGSGTRTLSIVAVAVILILSIRPVLASSIGFLLSVTAVCGLTLMVPPLVRRLCLWRFPRFFAYALAVPVAAQLAVTPIVLLAGGTMSAWAIPANMLVAPVIAPATILGFCTLACGLVSSFSAVVVHSVFEAPGLHHGIYHLCEFLGEITAVPGGWCAWWITYIAEFTADAPGAVWPWPEGILGVVLSLLLLGGVGVLLFLPGKYRTWVAAGLLLCLVCGTLIANFSLPLHKDWRVLVCDIGQGSATLVKASADTAVLIDAGPEPQSLDICLDKAGITYVQVIISHFDTDHFAGYPGIEERREVVGVQYSLDGKNHYRSRQFLRRLDPPQVTVVSKGERYTLGSLQWSILWPEAGETGAAEANNLSVVVYMQTPQFSLVIPGDVGEAQQRRLAAYTPQADVLLSPHHGSADLSEAFYSAVSPKFGVISVGEDNTYGHPTTRSIRAFGRIPILRTDQCGTIIITDDLDFTATEDSSHCPAPIR